MSDGDQDGMSGRRGFPSEADALGRLDERMASMQRGITDLRSDMRDRLENLKSDVRDRNETFRSEVIERIKALEEGKVSKDIFSPVQRIVYGMVTLIAAGFFAAIGTVVYVRDRPPDPAERPAASSQGPVR